MNAPNPAGTESFSAMGWPAVTSRPVTLRPGWLMAMVAEAQEQLHHGVLPAEPPSPRRRRPPVTAPPVQTLPLSVHTTASLPPPTLQHIEREDLTNIRRLLILYHHAVQQRLIGTSEAERLTFVALAQHVVSCRPKNLGGLFRHLLKQKRYHCVTQADEDAALQRLKQYLYERG